MDKSKKLRIDQWVEEALYKLLEEAMTKRQITPTDAATMVPLIQMHQAIQLENVCSELDSLWRLFEGGSIGVYISTIHDEMDVNVKRMPPDGPQQARKGS
jgi:hypothetical protein